MTPKAPTSTPMNDLVTYLRYVVDDDPCLQLVVPRYTNVADAAPAALIMLGMGPRHTDAVFLQVKAAYCQGWNATHVFM